MQEHQQNSHNVEQQPTPEAPTLGDASGVNVSGYVRIFDPNTQETMVESRE